MIANYETNNKLSLRRTYKIFLLIYIFAFNTFHLPALAQTAGPVLPAGINNSNAAEFSTIDLNGVDAIDGSFNVSIEEGSIGAGEGRLSMQRNYGKIGLTDNWPGQLIVSPDTYTNKVMLKFSKSTKLFTKVSGVFIPDRGDGSTLVSNVTGTQYIYTSSSGETVQYGTPPIVGSPAMYAGYIACTAINTKCVLAPLVITKPSGLSINLFWKELIVNVPKYYRDGTTASIAFDRLERVVSSSGYSIEIGYATVNPPPSPLVGDNWFRRSGIIFKNNNFASDAWPTVSYSYSSFPNPPEVQVTDTGGRIWKFRTTDYVNVDAVQRPGSTQYSTTVNRDTQGNVSSVIKDSFQTNYSRGFSASQDSTTTITYPDGGQTVVTYEKLVGRAKSVSDPLQRVTNYAYDASFRPTRVTAPEGNYTQYAYDPRGNIVSTTVASKPGSGLANVVTTAGFSASCANPVICNKPMSTRDAKGNQTDYTYAATHGGMLTVTSPASNAGVRPQTRYTYAVVNGITEVMRVSACQTVGSCAGASDEVVASVAYGANNLPTTVTSGSGDGSLIATTSYTHDSVGNTITMDGPLPGSADTTRIRYDTARQVVGIVGPDPDGGGSLRPRARRLSYNADGQVGYDETGTTAGQSDAEWTSFAAQFAQINGYDAVGRRTLKVMISGGPARRIRQYTFDGLNRPVCSVERMNLSAGNLPDACASSTPGAFGPDRITKNS